MKPYTERVITIIRQIPEGKVMTYGQIASLAGSPRGARQVVRILHSMSSKYHLPWHRVINSKGEIGIRNRELQARQRVLLQNEGIDFLNAFSINLKNFQFHPQPYEN
jgi:methylated-DNA-protein-cysteine methyltransferase-like protein